MKRILKLVFIGLLVITGIYLFLPGPAFPEPPPGSLISSEPADIESVYRKAYYTNLSRSEIMKYYKNEFNAPLQFGLNHPPEDATEIIRDQTRSNYLEELVHPWKESLFVNGFTPDKPQDIMVRDNKIYASKITIRFVPSTPAQRLTVLFMVAAICLLI